MLKTRALLAVLGGLPLLALLFLLPPFAWHILVFVVLAITGWEFLRIAGLDISTPLRLILATGLFSACMLAVLLLPVNTQWLIITASCGVWLAAFCWFFKSQFGSTDRRRFVALKIVVSGLYILPALLVITHLQSISPWLVLVMLTLIWSADTFAYFCGSMIGGPKLAKSISPNKTIAGLLGGLAGAMLVAIVWILIADIEFGWLLPACLVVVLVSVAGDLLASLLKRQSGRKDSSRLLPGHGGLVDRLDSTLSAAPFFALLAQHLLLPLNLFATL